MPRSFLASQLLFTPPVPVQRWDGKTVIVTGSNTGLGFEATCHFARLGAAKVIMAVRDTEKGNQAKQVLERDRNVPGVIEVWQLDLMSFDSVKEFADRVKTELTRLDAVVENAGMTTSTFRLAEGFESTLTVNVISTFLLAFLLLPKLKDTAVRFNTVPHLVVISSATHGWVKFPEQDASSTFEALNDPQTQTMGERYMVSKLLEVLVCREFAARHPLSQSLVVLNYVAPGMCHSSLGRDLKMPQAALFKLFMWILARSTECGSRTLVHAASAGADSHGGYLRDCEVQEPADIVLGEKGKTIQQKVWNELLAVLDKIEPSAVLDI